MPKIGKNILTKLSMLIILSFVMFSHFNQKQWNEEGAVINGDVRVYYTFLPALFVHNDLAIDDPFVYNKDGHLRVLFAEDVRGRRYLKGTCGMAILYSPFFFIGHGAAYLLDEPMDGYSYPYMFSLVMGSVVYLMMGLVFLSKLLRRYFDDHVVAVTLLILFLGSNAYFYYTGTMLYSHGFSLTFITLFIYGVIKWIESPSLRWAIIIGVSSGFFVLIRPIDLLFVLAIVTIGISSIDQLKNRFILFWKEKWHVLLMISAALILMTPQLAYNYYVGGSVFFNSYAQGGEGFFFGDPHLFDTVFSYHNGWLVYSPLMLFSVIGLVFLRKMKNELTTFIIPASLIYFFVISSWWCWWYVGFGNRAFINLYPLLAIPLAACVAFFLRRGRLIRIGFNITVLAGIFLTSFQVQQFRKGSIHWSDMTKEAYWDAFLQSGPSERFETYLIEGDVDNQRKGFENYLMPVVEVIKFQRFDFDSSGHDDARFVDFQAKNGVDGSMCSKIPDGHMYIGKIVLPPQPSANELLTSAWFKGGIEGKTHLTIYNDSRSFTEIGHEIVSEKGGWSKMISYTKIPEEAKNDTLYFTIWNEDTKAFSIDDIEFAWRNRSFVSEAQ
ncbi:MAG: hypothetical protein ACI865_000632 [Flavobacteriaceae bacterium]|jgi:hypothetical protein